MRPALLGLALVTVAAVPSDAQLARVSGAVYDSVASKVLAGAIVQLVDGEQPSRSRSVVSDLQGRFSFDSVTPSRYLLGFFHEAVDSLALDPLVVRLSVAPGADVRAMLAIPSRRTIVTSICGDSLSAESGVWLGTVRSAIDRRPVPAARVSAEWSRLAVTLQNVTRDQRSADAAAGESGMFAISGIPGGEAIFARAASATDSSGTISFFSPQDGFVRHDLYVGPSRVRETGRDSIGGAPLVALSGVGSLSGRVRSVAGTAIREARAVFWGREHERRSNANGTFFLDSLPLGTHTLEVRALGFVPERRLVHVLAPGLAAPDAREEFTLDSRQTYLDTVKVLAQRVYESPRYREFLDRKKRGFGYFMDEGALERRNAIFVSDYLRMIPGITIFPGQGFGGGQVAMRGTGLRAYCSPVVFIDGVRVFGGAGDLEVLVNPNDIRGLEVYTRASAMPMQFQTLEGCGSIVVWTGQRRVRPADPERKR